MEEMIDLFYADGKPSGVTIARGSGAPEGMYWAVVDVWVVTPDGRFLIQKRDMAKRKWAGYWASSAAGAVQSGETPDQACRRETSEEVGLITDFNRGGKIFEFLDDKRIHHVYLFCQEVDTDKLVLQPGEVSDARLATPGEIRRMIRDESMVPVDYLPQLLRMLPIFTHMYGKAD